MKVNIKPDVILNEKAIMQDIEKFVKTCAMTIVEEATESIKKFAYEQMLGYYGEYEPREYKRTDQMLNTSYKPFTTTMGEIYEGGIIINSSNTNHEKGKYYTEEDIYNDVWIKGIHGHEKVGYGDNVYWREIQGLPDRINRIKRKAYSRDFKRELLSKGFGKAKAQSYSILKFS